MALQQTLRAIKQGVLATVRLPSGAAQQAAAPISLRLWRGFGDAAGSFLDKGEVTDRVLNVVKGFEKVEEGKVRAQRPGVAVGLGSGRPQPGDRGPRV